MHVSPAYYKTAELPSPARTAVERAPVVLTRNTALLSSSSCIVSPHSSSSSSSSLKASSRSPSRSPRRSAKKPASTKSSTPSSSSSSSGKSARSQYSSCSTWFLPRRAKAVSIFGGGSGGGGGGGSSAECEIAIEPEHRRFVRRRTETRTGTRKGKEKGRGKGKHTASSGGVSLKGHALAQEEQGQEGESTERPTKTLQHVGLEDEADEDGDSAEFVLAPEVPETTAPQAESGDASSSILTLGDVRSESADGIRGCCPDNPVMAYLVSDAEPVPGAGQDGRTPLLAGMDPGVRVDVFDFLDSEVLRELESDPNAGVIDADGRRCTGAVDDGTKKDYVEAHDRHIEADDGKYYNAHLDEEDDDESFITAREPGFLVNAPNHEGYDDERRDTAAVNGFIQDYVEAYVRNDRHIDAPSKHYYNTHPNSSSSPSSSTPTFTTAHHHHHHQPPLSPNNPSHNTSTTAQAPQPTTVHLPLSWHRRPGLKKFIARTVAARLDLDCPGHYNDDEDDIDVNSLLNHLLSLPDAVQRYMWCAVDGVEEGLEGGS
ncbi:hypothetical protein EJ05DRAFT_485467 [Pseudovirgaria hyperparasitica]|uniref:Uncharacterized protein n=1 Tax=Pseudovirgaria hyperparasitica TaxID=470096 RepID=A0A6A6W9Q9_9PEZI|nr:uncharacterized protein EJ05DRAFT_485467 [Pseudovirgaria hyperparasitica]KAF2758327.1 hypothetical protein EJ05DRAFT_485467 [Pseudovirgaria hyperparasitica]